MAPPVARPEDYSRYVAWEPLTITVLRLTLFHSFSSWLAVFGASLAAFSTVGFVNAFGVFQEHFRTLLDGSSDSDISWIGSTAIALMSMLSPAVGMVVDKHGPAVRQACDRAPTPPPNTSSRYRYASEVSPSSSPSS